VLIFFVFLGNREGHPAEVSTIDAEMFTNIAEVDFELFRTDVYSFRSIASSDGMKILTTMFWVLPQLLRPF
jgi:hypothetical protein